MSLHSKFRIFLAVFGLSVVANVLVSVWCIHFYVASATRRFQVLMYRARDAEDTRRLLDELVSELRAREVRDQPYRDQRYRHLTQTIAARIASLDPNGQSALAADDGARLAELSAKLQEGCDRFVALLDQDRRTEAHALLTGPLTTECIKPLHHLLAAFARTTDQALTRTSGDIDSTQTTVTAILSINAGLAFLLAVLGVHLLRNWVLKPVDALKTAAEIHARGELEHRVTVASHDELGTLARAVNQSAESLLEIQGRLVAQERLAAIGEVAASIAHNIRNPLASVRASAQSARDELVGDEINRQRLDQVIATVDSLSRWLRELLMVNRPIELSRCAVPVEEIVGRVLAVVEPAARRHHINLRFQDGAAALLHVDAPRVEQALLAIVENAIEASPPQAEVRVAVRCPEPASRWIELVVCDSGPGLPPEVAASMDRPYFSTKPGGTGIGVHLARRIVQAHGGEVTFQNAGPQGTMVVLRLPAAEETTEGGPRGPSSSG